ncbi:hypothetical protein [Geomicrobium sp. JCM 19039]|uniref:hypothetical protein n=1 Tax=Geomicrobium sp. JCM 19039 TaxID=1460636 RepID=UPI00045F443D|nr:hypothetical protein [Geomicrobium sp. JCM 19039]GAK14730.1 hypothetical protein JCM19039_4690 [Geomicrobium sp. JCM 19039]
MLNKGLLKKDLRSSSLILTLFATLLFLIYPLRTILDLQHLRLMEQQDPMVFNNMTEYVVRDIFSGNILSFFPILLVVVLGGMLIGLERNTRRHDFSLSLPFSRRQLFLTKVMIGMSAIFIIFTVNMLLSYLLIWFSDYQDLLVQFEALEMYVIPVLAYMATFAFTLFMGGISGEMVSQIVLTFIFLVFPYGFSMLLLVFLDVHGLGHVQFADEWIYLLLPAQIMGIGYYMDIHPLVYVFVSVTVLVISVGIGSLLYERSKAERNGEFILYAALKPVFFVAIVICFAMFGGMIFTFVGSVTGLTVLSYWLGAFIIGGIAYLITRRLLDMNVTLKTN